MRLRRLLTFFFLIYLAYRGHCFKNGYSEGTCDNLIPNVEKDEPNVTLSHSPIPFQIVTSTKYRLGRTLAIILEGEDIEGFQLQIRQSVAGSQSERRIGEFVGWNDNYAKPLQCDDGEDTSVTHKTMDKKKDLNFVWKAPDEDMGVLKLVDAYVASNGEYWTKLSDIRLDCADLPVSVNDCGKNNKSCVRFSVSGEGMCDGNTCSYMMTYEIQDKSVEFTLGSLTNAIYSFSAIGFRKTKEDDIHLTACVRDDRDDVNVFVKNYVVNSNDDEISEVNAETANIHDVIVDNEGNNTWCQFKKPIRDVDEAGLDLNKELIWLFVKGGVNEITNTPMLEEYFGTNKTHIVTNIINEINDKGSSSIPVAAVIFVCVSSLFSLIFPKM